MNQEEIQNMITHGPIYVAHKQAGHISLFSPCNPIVYYTLIHQQIVHYFTLLKTTH